MQIVGGKDQERVRAQRVWLGFWFALLLLRFTLYGLLGSDALDLHRLGADLRRQARALEQQAPLVAHSVRTHLDEPPLPPAGAAVLIVAASVGAVVALSVLGVTLFRWQHPYGRLAAAGASWVAVAPLEGTSAPWEAIVVALTCVWSAAETWRLPRLPPPVTQNLAGKGADVPPA